MLEIITGDTAAWRFFLRCVLPKFTFSSPLCQLWYFMVSPANNTTCYPILLIPHRASSTTCSTLSSALIGKTSISSTPTSSCIFA